MDFRSGRNVGIVASLIAKAMDRNRPGALNSYSSHRMTDKCSNDRDMLKDASNMGRTDSSECFYDKWAADYEEELLDSAGYIAPQISAREFSKVCTDPRASVIDYGCGTGLVGVELKERGFTNLYGVDISTSMLSHAESKSLYELLVRADLTKPAPFVKNSFDAGLCVGSMGAGHLDAAHIPNLLRPLRNGAYLVIFMNEQHYLEEQFENRMRKMELSRYWEILASDRLNYMTRMERPGRLIIGRKHN